VTARIFVKLIFGVLCLLIVALSAVDVLASRVAESNYREHLSRELEQKARMLTLLYHAGDSEAAREALEQLSAVDGSRITAIAPDGRVLADTEGDPDRMENHRQRPEVMEALNGRVGQSIRRSPTVGEEFLYVAVPSPQGAMRVAVPMSAMAEQVNSIRKRLLFSTALAFVPAILIAGFFARYVSSRLGRIIDYAGKLAEGNFRARLERPGTDELGILSGKLNETGEKLEKMFEELQREHQELEKLERVRKDFVINVSHELRTPLASIQGYTETLLNGAIEDKQYNVRFLDIIRQNAERLSNLAADLLTLSRIELKTQKFQFASYYVNVLLLDCVDSMRPMADRKEIELHIEYTEEDAEVFCDSKAVHQALGNLMDNAIKYTPEGGGIYVGARPAAGPAGAGRYYEFYVRDTGIGIPAEELPRLFERFYRVDKARSRELGGTGLGLAIVKHLARAHGGDVRVESEMGKGSTFCFTLPVDDEGVLEDKPLQSELTIS
jgi:two-component system, OmpR family, phosphate regulon sensor histidine kinase PhoR